MMMMPSSKFLLSLASSFDRYGAKEWNLRAVAATSAILFLAIRRQLGRKREIEWDSFVHAFIIGIGSAICIYLNANVTGVKEPIRSVVDCGGPLTSLHRIIPAITQGYAICDVIQGYHLLFNEGHGAEFLAHGIGTFIVATVFNEFEASHILTPMLILEGSTIILAIIKADFLSQNMQILCQAAFVISYFLCRIVMFPYLYIETMSIGPKSMGDCFPTDLFYFSLVFGALFHSLNFFWFMKLIRKVRRKIAGKESIGCASRK